MFKNDIFFFLFFHLVNHLDVITINVTLIMYNFLVLFDPSRLNVEG